MGEAAALGLRHLGVRAYFRPRNDIEIEGRKISGTGGTELSGAILFQGDRPGRFRTSMRC